MARALVQPGPASEDIEATAETMREAGATPADIRKYLEGAARQVEIVDVLYENAAIVEAFRRCSLPAAASMGGVFYNRTREQDIRAVIAVMRVPLAERLDVFDGVQLMQAVALPIIND